MQPRVHSLTTRLTHWINAGSVLIMLGSGLQIHNAYPIMPFKFPQWMTVGDWLGGALLWHFAAMWIFAANLVVMISIGVLSGRYGRKLFPLRPREIGRDLLAVFQRRDLHPHPGHYNAIQKLLYLGVLVALAVLVVSGAALWKPVQFQGLTAVMGGFQGARLVHFIAMAAVAGFLILHVVMAVLVPRSLRQMILGR